MAISNATLSLGISNIFVSSGNTVVSAMYFCNHGAASANLNVWLLSSGNSVASTSTLVYREIQIAAADTFVVDREKLALANGDQIKANAGGTVSATVNYVGM